VPLVYSSLVNIATLYLGSRLKTGFITSTPILNTLKLHHCERFRSQEKSCLNLCFHNSKLTIHTIQYKNLNQNIHLNVILSEVSQYERLKVLGMNYIHQLLV